MGNKIVHWELMGPDGGALKSFYSDLFGWESAEVEGFDGYHMVSAESSGLAGAVGKGSEQMPQYQTIYVEVPDVDKHLAKAEELGGKTVLPRTVVPDTVTFGLFTDPAGNMVGVVEADTPPSR